MSNETVRSGSEAMDFGYLDRAKMFDALIEAARALLISVSGDELTILIGELFDRYESLFMEREFFFSYDFPLIADSFTNRDGIYGNILAEKDREFVRGIISGSREWHVSEEDLNHLSFLYLLGAVIYRAKIEAHIAGNTGVYDMLMQEQILVNSLLGSDASRAVDKKDLAKFARIVVDPATGQAYPDIEDALIGYRKALSAKDPFLPEAVEGAFTMHTLRSLERIVAKELGPEEYAERDPIPDLLKTDSGNIYESAERPTIREEDALNTYKDNEDYTNFKDSDGVYRREDVGYEGQIAVTVDNGFTSIPFPYRNACIVRLAKSFASVLTGEARFAGPARVEIMVLQSLEPLPDIRPGRWERHVNTDGGLIIDRELKEGSGPRVCAFVREDLLGAGLKRDEQRRIIAETLSAHALTANGTEREEEAHAAGREKVRRPVRVLFLDSPFSGTKMPMKVNSASLFLGTALKDRGIEVDISSLECSAVEGEYEQGVRVSEERLKKMLARGYDIVAFGFSADIGLDRINGFTAAIRGNTDALIAVGGPMPTLFPEHMLAHLPHVNILIRGEAEEAFPRVIAALSLSRDLAFTEEVKEDLSRVKGAWVAAGNTYWINDLNYRNMIMDLDAVDIDFGLINPDDITLAMDEGLLKILGLVFSRGCPKACIFCSHVLTKRVRTISADKMIKMVLDCQAALVEEGIPLFLYPQDDDFFIRPSHAMEFIEKCHNLRNRGVLKVDFASLQVSLESLITEKNGRRLPHDDLLNCIDRCRNIFVQDMPRLVIGTDSFTDRGLSQLKKGKVGHPYTVSEVEDVVEALEQRGVGNEHFVIMGHPESKDVDVALCCHVIALLYDRYEHFSVREVIPGIIPDPSLPVVKTLQAQQRNIENYLASDFLRIERFPEFTFFEKGFIIPPGLDFFCLHGPHMQNLTTGHSKERFREMAHAFWGREVRRLKRELILVVISRNANRARSCKSKLSRTGFYSVKTFRTIKEVLPSLKDDSGKLILNLNGEEKEQVPAVFANRVISYSGDGPKSGTMPGEISDMTNILDDWIIDHLIVPRLAEEHTVGIREILYRRWLFRSGNTSL